MIRKLLLVDRYNLAKILAYPRISNEHTHTQRLIVKIVYVDRRTTVNKIGFFVLRIPSFPS
mgnify:CR=1 FL=1